VEEAWGDAGLSAWNRFLDRIRSPEAARVAGDAGQTGGFDILRDSKYTLLVTFKRSGEPVPTPVWAGLDERGRLYVRSERDVAKVRRVRNNPHVRVAACNSRGKPRGPVIEGQARVLSAEEEEHAEQALRSHYGLGRRVYEGTMGAAAGPMVYIEVSPAGQEAPA
jgi:PPOX class probable F420-dependent enzyme